MLGLVFTEFVTMVDEEYSPQFTEELIAKVSPESGGAYTSFGGYPAKELEALVGEIRRSTGRETHEIYIALGRFIVSSLAERCSAYFQSNSDPFEFLQTVHARVQHEARKLYREEDLPRLTALKPGPNLLQFDCESHPVFASIVLGGVMGVLDYYEADVTLDAQTIEEGDSRCQRFILRRRQVKAA